MQKAEIYLCVHLKPPVWQTTSTELLFPEWISTLFHYVYDHTVKQADTDQMSRAKNQNITIHHKSLQYLLVHCLRYTILNFLLHVLDLSKGDYTRNESLMALLLYMLRFVPLILPIKLVLLIMTYPSTKDYLTTPSLFF